MRLFFAGLAVAFLTLSVGGPALAADAPKDAIQIDACKAKKAAVTFEHSKHVNQEGVSCNTCHHTGDTAKSCADCHKTQQEGAPGVCTDMSLSKNPFHVNCVSCHKEKKAGPTKCGDCHK